MANFYEFPADFSEAVKVEDVVPERFSEIDYRGRTLLLRDTGKMLWYRFNRTADELTRGEIDCWVPFAEYFCEDDVAKFIIDRMFDGKKR